MIAGISCANARARSWQPETAELVHKKGSACRLRFCRGNTRALPDLWRSTHFSPAPTVTRTERLRRTPKTKHFVNPTEARKSSKRAESNLRAERFRNTFSREKQHCKLNLLFFLLFFSEAATCTSNGSVRNSRFGKPSV